MSELERAAENIRREIESAVFSVGVLARVFGRGKSERSIYKKVNKEPGKYSTGGRLIQDGIGIRVALYFADDSGLVEAILKRLYEFLPDASSIDSIDEHTFNVVRRNLVFRLPGEHASAVSRLVSRGSPIDSTFEVQIRSVLSEGWHEVEHDLRYKCKSAWVGHSDLNRALNGVMASLETSEWSMLKIFDDLAFRHYRSRDWAAMCHAKLRVRAEPAINSQILAVFNSDPVLPKAFYKFSRATILRVIVDKNLSFPITIDNMIYLWNWIDAKNVEIDRIIPEPIRDVFQGI